MSFIIEKVVLSNFRTHKFLEFEPLSNGVTVIKGANGSGKSSLVDSVAWVIYGTKPSGVSKNTDLRRKDMVIDKEQCYVELTLKTSSGAYYKIQRRIVGGAKGTVKCDIWEINHDSDGNELLNHVAGDSVTHANEFILKNLHVSEKSFLASMFVQQKEVDELIKAKPSERSFVIEKMTGIAALTDAVSEIRKDVNDRKKTVEIMERNREGIDNIEELRQEIKEISEKIKEYDNNIQKLSEKHDIEKQELITVKEKLQKVLSLEQKLNNSQQEKNRIIQNIELFDEEIKSINNTISNKKKELEEIVHDDFNPKTIVAQYKEIKNNLETIESNVSNLKINKENIRNKMLQYMRFKDTLSNLGIVFTKDDFSGDLNTILNKIGDAINVVIKEKEDSYNDYDSVSQQLDKSRAEKGNIEYIISNHNETINALDNDHGECPTCHQKPDNIVQLLSNIRDMKNKEEQNLVVVNQKINELSGSYSEKENSYKVFTELEKDLRVLYDNYPEFFDISNQIRNYHNDYVKLKEGFEQVSNDYNNVRTYQNIKNTISEYEDKLESYQERKESTLILLKDNDNVLSDVSLELSSHSSSGELSPVVDSLTNSIDNIKNEISYYENSKSQSKMKIDYVEKDIIRAENSQKEYEKSIDDLSRVTAGLDMVSSYREVLIEKVIPEISYVASELLQKFTDGKFVGMELDSSYKAKVQLPDGSTRDTGLLSGGELSAVALALRLAIALISYGSNVGTSTMILDEVLVSQDENRVENIITTMKEKLQGQVILIGHNGDIISSIADNIVELG